MHFLIVKNVYLHESHSPTKECIHYHFALMQKAKIPTLNFWPLAYWPGLMQPSLFALALGRYSKFHSQHFCLVAPIQKN